MKIRLFVLFAFISLFFAPQLKAGASLPIDTTVKHTITEIYTEGNLVPYNIWQLVPYKDVDTTLDNLEFYTTHYNLGNPGLPYVPIFFNSTPAPLGFFYGKDNLSDYFRNDETIKYYDTRAPYLNFFYITDPQIHQFLDLSLTQNFGKKFNVGFEFHRNRSEGTYNNQGSNNNQLALSARYTTKRYLLLFSGIYSIYKVNQNGGMQTDTVFNNSNYSDRLTVPVYLGTARTTIIKTSVTLKQFYFFGYKSSDTAKENPLMYINYTGNLSGNTNMFTDLTFAQDSVGFYNNFYHSQTATYDSLRYNEFNNDFSIGSAKGWNAPIRWDLGIKDQWVHFTDYIYTQSGTPIDIINTPNMYRDSIFTNLIAHARIYNTYANGRVLFDASGGYIVSGTQKGDEQGSADLGFRIDSSRLIELSGNYSFQTPALLFDMYDGNNFQWVNHFNKVTTSTASLKYMDAKWHIMLGGEATQIQNMVYFTSTNLPNSATPWQYSGTVNVLKANIEKDFTLGKWHWNAKEVYQNVATYAPIHLPLWVTQNSFFYENYLFKHHLLLKVGIDIFYNSSYYADAYQPVFNQFYLQGQHKVGNYAYFDPFVSFRIKTFRMFIALENAGAQTIQTSGFYGYAPNYPMPDLTLRFGISWDFWN